MTLGMAVDMKKMFEEKLRDLKMENTLLKDQMTKRIKQTMSKTKKLKQTKVGRKKRCDVQDKQKRIRVHGRF